MPGYKFKTNTIRFVFSAEVNCIYSTHTGSHKTMADPSFLISEVYQLNLSLKIFITVRKRSCGKVMFHKRVSRILSTGGM